MGPLFCGSGTAGVPGAGLLAAATTSVDPSLARGWRREALAPAGRGRTVGALEGGREVERRTEAEAAGDFVERGVAPGQLAARLRQPQVEQAFERDKRLKGTGYFGLFGVEGQVVPVVPRRLYERVQGADVPMPRRLFLLNYSGCRSKRNRSGLNICGRRHSGCRVNGETGRAEGHSAAARRRQGGLTGWLAARGLGR